jgi:hypothetical protein
MNRRHVLKGMGVATLYGSFPAILSEFLVSCNQKDKQLRAGFFSDAEFSLVEAITDAMLPKTSTPGGLETQVPYFTDLVIKNCISATDQQLIKKGLQQLEEQAGGKFTSLTRQEQLSIIKKTDEAAFKDDAGKAWFRIFKKLATIGYFTSKDGMEKALRYVKVPGEYNACVPYKAGDKGLAKTFLMYW